MFGLILKGALDGLRRYWPLLLALGLGLVLVAMVQSFARSQRQAGRDEIKTAWDADRLARAEASAQITASLSTAVTGISDAIRANDERVIAEGRNITIKLDREMRNDPRYSAAGCAVTGSVLSQINTARRLSGGAPVATGDLRTVPTTPPAE